MTPFKTRYFPRTGEVNVWNVYTQTWTGRVPVTRVAKNDRLMASLPARDRDRIRRMAA